MVLNMRVRRQELYGFLKNKKRDKAGSIYRDFKGI